MLADCRCDAITQYHASLVEPATSQLLIVMELMAATAADLVRADIRQAQQRRAEWDCGGFHCCKPATKKGIRKGMHDPHAGTAPILRIRLAACMLMLRLPSCKCAWVVRFGDSCEAGLSTTV